LLEKVVNLWDVTDLSSIIHTNLNVLVIHNYDVGGLQVAAAGRGVRKMSLWRNHQKRHQNARMGYSASVDLNETPAQIVQYQQNNYRFQKRSVWLLQSGALIARELKQRCERE
jgi:hypothetical protein